MSYYFNMLRFATLVGGGLIGFFVEYFWTDDLSRIVSILPTSGLIVILLWSKLKKSSSYFGGDKMINDGST